MHGATLPLTVPQVRAALDVIGPATIMQAKTKHAIFIRPAISPLGFGVFGCLQKQMCVMILGGDEES